MPVLPVHLHLPDDSTVPATLSTDHSQSSYGRPVLLLAPDDAGPRFDPDGPPIPHGPGDVTRHGVAAELPVEAAGEPLDAAGARLLSAWRSACASYRGRGGHMEPAPPEAAPVASSAAEGTLETVGRILLPDNRELRVLRTPDPENGPRILLRLSPSQSQSSEGVDLSTAAALELVRALDRALRLPAIEDTGTAGTGEDR